MKIISTLVLSIAMLSFCQAQEFFTIKQQLSLGEQTAFGVDHPDAEKKMVEKTLEETFKQYGKVKRNRKAKEWVCQQCDIPGINSGPVDAYFKVEEKKGMTTSYVFIDDGTQFLSEPTDAIDKVNNLVYVGVKKRVINKELDNEEKVLKNYDKDLNKLEKKNKELHDDIEEYKEKIKKAEKEIEQNLQNQEDKKIEIEQQKRKVEEITERLNKVGRN